MSFFNSGMRGVGIFGKASVDRLNSRLPDEIGSIKITFAGSKAHYILALAAKLFRFRSDGKGGRRLKSSE